MPKHDKLSNPYAADKHVIGASVALPTLRLAGVCTLPDPATISRQGALLWRQWWFLWRRLHEYLLHWDFFLAPLLSLERRSQLEQAILPCFNWFVEWTHNGS